MALVSEVTYVSIEIQKSNPPVLVVTVKGNAPSTGWTNPVLISRLYPGGVPLDGILDLDLEATPPAAISGGAITALDEAKFEWPDFKPWLRGIRVHSKTNHITKFLGEQESDRSDSELSVSLSADPDEIWVNLMPGGIDIPGFPNGVPIPQPRSVRFTFRIHNTGQKKIQFQHPNTGFIKFEVRLSGKLIWVFPDSTNPKVTHVSFEPNQLRTYDSIWNIEDVRQFLPSNLEAKAIFLPTSLAASLAIPVRSAH